MKAIINDISSFDVVTVLGTILAFLFPLIGRFWFKDYVFTEKDIGKKIGLARESLVEKHSLGLKLYLNIRDKRLLSGNEEDIKITLNNYSKELQNQMCQNYIFEWLFLQIRYAYNLLLYTSYCAFILLLLSIFAIASNNNILCWVIIGCVLVVFFFQGMIITVLRKSKHYADDKTKINEL